ncbi:zinc finger MYM-type protein 1-like [Bufo gargarizans]|uniref:zinc finger MYM-type protein 1-like n=1 Tax=Bufo gargarizans TaxID=30331 RepID=UPI001CF3345B|nr:zinc finger MYM-type protein 1-like [Bufo gargarizans]
MSDGRKRLSGAGYRKNAKIRREKQARELEQTGKIEQFFTKPVASSNTEQGEEVVEDLTADICETDVATSCSYDTSIATSSTSIARETETSESGPSSSVEFDDPVVQIGVSSDPAEWVLNDCTRDHVAKHGIIQNENLDFTQSRRLYADHSRLLTKHLFEKENFNGEKQKRSYLVYSKSKGVVFCAPCRLFGGKSQLAESGFNDWKNGTARLNEHERSAEHKSCVLSLKSRACTLGRIDESLTKQRSDEIQYWRNVLKRVVAAVKALGTRGLAFRGKDDRFGSTHNGNYMMMFEFLSEFDPFIAEHIARYGNAGKGVTSYLSFTTCEQFIQLMADSVTKQIVKEAKAAKYYSISVDSTPDSSHTDQLAFILRYVKEDGLPIERFLHFIPNPGHKSEQLAEVVLTTLKSYDLDIANCRGQSYDNASNMSGHYRGLQARILERNPLAVYIPCAAHSLNLVGKHAAESCPEACSFFGLLQYLYIFFTASTHRWEILQKHLSSVPNTVAVKRLSDTRWSAREDACRSLNRNWTQVIEALTKIKENTAEAPGTCKEAEGLLNKIQRLETALMSGLWGTILDRFGAVSKKLQSIGIDVGIVGELYESLIQFVRETRGLFPTFEAAAMEKSVVKDYETKRKGVQAQKVSATSSKTQAEVAQENFRINTFYVICDNLVAELMRRKSAYDSFVGKFKFITELSKTEPSAISQHANNLCSSYSKDLEQECFVDECLHFRSYLISSSAEDTSVLVMSRMIRERGLQSIYLNVDIALRMFLCTAATNCSAERSFSTLKRVKNYLRSRMGEERLNSLAVLAIESELTKSLDYEELINSFATQRVRRKAF